MERAARQSLILNDPVLRRRFEEESARARAALERLTDQGLAKPPLHGAGRRSWRSYPS